MQFIDNSDSKKFFEHLPSYLSKYFSDFIGFRYCHNKTPQAMIKKRDGRMFYELWDLINNSVPFQLITIGFYYDQVTDNLKEQIAINAVPMQFQGYNVGILNFNAPALTHPVCRQIVSNFKAKGIPIDFAVCWGYEHINKCYRIQMSDDHQQTRFNLGYIAQKLGKIGGLIKFGGGHPHIGNFYWPHSKEKDIWDLFSKNYLKNKYN